MKINRIKTAELKKLKETLEQKNQQESVYFRHVAEELARRTEVRK